MPVLVKKVVLQGPGPTQVCGGFEVGRIRANKIMVKELQLRSVGLHLLYEIWRQSRSSSSDLKEYNTYVPLA